MKKLTYSFYDIDGYSGTDIAELTKIFQRGKLRPVPGEFGGGGESIHQVIAWLTVHWDDISINLLTAYLVSILNKLWEWHKLRLPKREKVIPVVKISICITNEVSTTVEYPINKNYKKEEIKIVEESVK